MRRFNEYTPEQLENLSMLLSIVGGQELVADPGRRVRDLNMFKFWADEVQQAKKESTESEERLPWPFDKMETLTLS